MLCVPMRRKLTTSPSQLNVNRYDCVTRASQMSAVPSIFFTRSEGWRGFSSNSRMAFSNCFWIPRGIQKQFEKAIRLFEENPRHPSLRVKKMEGTADIWEARVTQSYRFTFNWEGDVVSLRRMGTHNILRKE